MKMHFQTLLGGMDTGTQMQKEVARKRMEEVGPDQQIMWMRHDQRVKRGASDDQMLQCAVLDFLEGSSAENAKALVQAQRRPTVGEMARELAEKTFREAETELKCVEAWQEMLKEGPELQKMLNGKQLRVERRSQGRDDLGDEAVHVGRALSDEGATAGIVDGPQAVVAWNGGFRIGRGR